MGPQEEVLALEVDGPEEKGLFVRGEVGEEVVNCVDDGGRVSHERVRRQDCRIMEKDVGARGSWVEV